VQSIISGAAEGATFVMRAGTYRIGGIAPRNNQTILAETPGSVILNGSRLVTPTAEGPYWVVTGQTQQGQVHGECDSGHPRCAYPEDLFVDDVPQLHVASISAVGPGKWFFDYNADKVYMGRESGRPSRRDLGVPQCDLQRCHGRHRARRRG
jgi:hypothetical protein